MRTFFLIHGVLVFWRHQKTVQNGPKRSKTVQNGPKRSKTVQNGPKRSKTVQNGPKRSKNGPKRSKTVQNGPKRSKTVLDQVSAEATLASNGSRITSKTVVDRIQNLVFAQRVLSTLDISPLKTLNVVLATRLPNLSCWSWYEENLCAKRPILAKQILVFVWWQTLQLSKVWVHKKRKICVTPDVTDWCRELK